MNNLIFLLLLGLGTVGAKAATRQVRAYEDHREPADDHEYSDEEPEEKPEFPYTSEILETAYFLTEVYLHGRSDAGIRRLENSLSDVNVKLDQLLAASGAQFNGKQVDKSNAWHAARRVAFIAVKFARMFQMF